MENSNIGKAAEEFDGMTNALIDFEKSIKELLPEHIFEPIGAEISRFMVYLAVRRPREN